MQFTKIQDIGILILNLIIIVNYVIKLYLYLVISSTSAVGFGG